MTAEQIQEIADVLQCIAIGLVFVLMVVLIPLRVVGVDDALRVSAIICGINTVLGTGLWFWRLVRR